MRRTCTGLAAMALVSGWALAAGAEFAEKPKVTADGEKVKIEFALSAPTDVEVAILDAGAGAGPARAAGPPGRVVRHLAAGVVGKPEAAAPLKAGSLAQSLVWDYTDDLGRPVGGEAFTVRVRVGMRVAFGQTVGGSAYVVDALRGIATDGEGKLYLLSQSYRAGAGKSAGPRYIQVFDRAGKYLQTIMPYSAGLPRQDVAGFGLIDTGESAVTPRNQEGVWPQVYPLNDLFLQPRVGENGHLVSCDYAEVLRIDTRGAAVNNFKGVPLWPAEKPKFSYNQAGPLFAALAADGKRLYVAGPYVDPTKADAKMLEAWPKGRVYVLDLATSGKGTGYPDVKVPGTFSAAGGGAQPFVTVDTTRDRDLEVPSAAKTLRRPAHGPVHGLATDRAGNVYVCDRANDRVAVYDATGKLTGRIPARQPHLVAVHPSAGEVYVLTLRPLAYQLNEVRLLKFAKAGAERPSAELDLPAETAGPTMALDASARPALLWLTGARGSEVWRIEDRGEKLELAGKLPVSNSGALYGADRLAVDYETDDLYINDGWSSLARYNGLTGKGGIIGESRALRQVWERDTNQRTNLTATDATVGPDGFVYLRNGPQYSGPITRWTRDLTPAPFPATNSHVLRRYIYSRYGAGYGERGFTVHPDGRVFVMSMYNWNAYFVHVFAPDGTSIEERRLKGQLQAYAGLDADIQGGLIGPLTAGCGGLKVDAAGNVYVGMRLFPDGFKPPRGFEGDAAYRQLSGSVFKFGPAGGGVLGGKRTGTEGIQGDGGFVEGAVAAYPDFAPFSGGFGSGCVCRSPRFDLDPFGRLYIPNAVRFKVRVVDNAGNEVIAFGQYGNMDDPGAAGVIPLGWPIAVGVSTGHIYVSDMLNKRVARVDLSWAETAEAAILAPRKGAEPSPLFAAARTRADQVWTEVVPASKALDQPWLKRALALALTRQTAPATLADARVNLLHLTRLVPGWPAKEAEAVAGKFLADADPRVRLAALWALDRDDVNEVTVKLAKAALDDKDERVRTFAAIVLFDRGHGDGLATILAAARAGSQWVLDMARPAATEEIIVEGGPKYLKYPVGEKEVDLATALLNDAYNNMRAVGAGILMLSGNPRAPKALADRLAVEEISFIRARLIGGFQRQRMREGVQPLLADVSTGPGARKKGTGWGAAEGLADIGDPESVQPLIDLLDQPAAQDLALFALSRAFDEGVTTSGDYRLIPDPAKGLVRVALVELPPPADRKKAWQTFWSDNKTKYTWNPKEHPLRAKAR